MERRPHGVETPGRPRDPSNARLEPADPHVVAHVPGFGLVGVSVHMRHAHVVAGGHPHGRVGEARDQRLERPRGRPRRGIGGDDDVTAQQR